MKDTFNIATIAPFWRYAVCPSQNSIPGIPFYTLKGATKFFNETSNYLPWFDCYLLKRRWRGVELLEKYTGKGF